MVRSVNNGIRKVNASSPGVRGISVIHNVDGTCFSIHPDAVMLAMQPILRDIGCIYCYGNNIILDKKNEIITVVEEGVPVKTASSIMANYLLAQADNKDDSVPQPPSSSFLQHVFNSDLVLENMPIVKRYSKMPVYDEDFILHQPGYDQTSGILVHGEVIDPLPFVPPDPTLPIEERPPAIIREMLIDFPFAAVTDLINAIGLLLITLLAPLFTATGRPLGLFNGNQPGVGKTLFANILGIILDGGVPSPTEFTTSNDELSKRILATIRSRPQSVLFIDNARMPAGTAINSTTLEAMGVAETLSLRILGVSSNHTQPNDYVWLISMNDLKTTPDLAQRGVLVRLVFEGPPSLRKYHHNDLLAFVKKNRMEIIATFYGMIEHWKSQGQPDGKASHRFSNMARIIGGILDSCGLPGFLEDHQETVQTINSTADDLTALFEAVIDNPGDSLVQASATSFQLPHTPRAAGELLPVVMQAGIAKEELAMAKTDRAKSTRIGQVFRGW